MGRKRIMTVIGGRNTLSKAVHLRLSKAGHIIINPPDASDLPEEDKIAIDINVLSCIDVSNALFVIDIDGIDESMARQIAYAEEHRKSVFKYSEFKNKNGRMMNTMEIKEGILGDITSDAADSGIDPLDPSHLAAQKVRSRSMRDTINRKLKNPGG